MRLWLAALLPPPLPLPAVRGTAVAIRTYPLIGMPSWSPLRLHVAVACGDTVYDFVPDDATSPATLARLLSGKSVGATIRCRPRRPTDRWRVVGSTTRTAGELGAWVDSYPGELDLGGNNCWTFASALVRFALTSEPWRPDAGLVVTAPGAQSWSPVGPRGGRPAEGRGVGGCGGGGAGNP